MTDLRQAAQHVVDTLEDLFYGTREETDLAIDALKSALAQPEQEPGAWKGLTPDETMLLMNQTAGQHWADEAHIQRFRAALEETLKEKNT